MIQLNNISRTFNKGSSNEVCALKKVNLTVNKGEFVAVVGTSGAGKSTLLRIIGCIDSPNEGTYLLNGKKVNFSNNNDLSSYRRNDIGFVLQDFGLIENETALSNVKLPLYFSGFKGSKNKEAMKILKLLGIENLAEKKINQLSGGQKQRVAICRALINNPSLIIADEPTGALDNTTSGEIMSLFESLNNNGKTIIIVTHDMNIADRCKRRITISDGCIISDI